jgi:hypothetical protein
MILIQKAEFYEFLFIKLVYLGFFDMRTSIGQVSGGWLTFLWRFLDYI